jgi:hypothetical protein
VPDDKHLQTRRPTPSVAERERTIAFLSDRFSRGDLDLEAFEERVTIAHRAGSQEELVALTADLAPTAEAVVASSPMTIAPETPEHDEALAIFGGVQRTGRWRVPRRMRAVAGFGGIDLDFRNAELPAGPFALDVRATFGGVQIIVPPNLAVEVHGSAIFGGFAHMDRVPPSPDPNAPVLHVYGKVVFGGVSIETRPADQTDPQQHQRKLLR